MEAKAFKGIVHIYKLNGESRFVVDPRAIPAEVRDALCVKQDYWRDSMIGPNHDVAHYDLNRKAWRDMRHAALLHSFDQQTIIYDGASLRWC
jgi:hypothetical protein